MQVSFVLKTYQLEQLDLDVVPAVGSPVTLKTWPLNPPVGQPMQNILVTATVQSVLGYYFVDGKHLVTLQLGDPVTESPYTD